MVVIGLTGGIASGKSTVSEVLSKLGAVVLNADEVGHELFQPHTEAWQEVAGTFGGEILTEDGEVDRSKLGELVFHNPEALRQLNEIMHPKMLSITRDKIDDLRRLGVEVLILEAPLLIEANWTGLVDYIWVTIAPEAVVLERLCHRDGFSIEQARARLRSQMPPEEKLKYADAVINTDCSLEQVRAQVEKLWHKLQPRGIAYE